MATVIHELITGGVIEYESTPELEAFLRQVLKVLKDPNATNADMVDLVYGADNPILDKTMFPGRGAVTKPIHGSPIYRVFTDLVERKERQRTRARRDAAAAV